MLFALVSRRRECAYFAPSSPPRDTPRFRAKFFIPSKSSAAERVRSNPPTCGPVLVRLSRTPPVVAGTGGGLSQIWLHIRPGLGFKVVAQKGTPRTEYSVLRTRMRARGLPLHTLDTWYPAEELKLLVGKIQGISYLMLCAARLLGFRFSVPTFSDPCHMLMIMHRAWGASPPR